MAKSEFEFLAGKQFRQAMEEHAEMMRQRHQWVLDMFNRKIRYTLDVKPERKPARKP